MTARVLPRTVWVALAPLAIFLGCSTTLDLNALSQGCSGGQLTCAGGESSSNGGDSGAAIGNAGEGNATGGDGPAHVACEIVQRFTFDPGKPVNSVHLSGSMNAWSEPGDELTADKDGGYSLELALRPGEYFYKFIVDGTTWVQDPANPNSAADGFGSLNSVVSVYPSEGATFTGDCDTACFDTAPFAWQDAVMYSAMIDRFADSDGQGSEPSADGSSDNPRFGWGGGDIAGVTSQLPYLADLGMSLIWITPPQKAAAGGYHGYWPVRPDTRYVEGARPSPAPELESHFGTPKQLKSFVDAAHATVSANGSAMKVMLDYVANHVDESSPLAVAHPSWFFLRDGKPVLCDNGTATPTDDLWDDPYWGTHCSFSSFLWKFDYEASPEALAWSMADIRYWLAEYGFDALRIDAARHQPSVWVEHLRESMDQVRVSDGLKPYLMGETFSYDPAVVAKAVDPETRFDGQLDFPTRKSFCEALLSEKSPMSNLAYELALNSTLYPDGSVMATWLGNHDIPRQIEHATGEIADCLAGSNSDNNQPSGFAQPDDDVAYRRLALAFVALLTNPGLPVIYAGDEIGLAGGGDPENRRMMVWSDAALRPSQKALRSTIRELANLRGKNRALSRGPRRTFSADENTWVFERLGCGEASGFVVAINRSTAKLTRALPAGAYAELVAGNAKWDGGKQVTLGPQSFAVLRRK